MSRRLVQANVSDVRALARRRIAKLIAPNPISIIAQVAGSGTAAVLAVAKDTLFWKLPNPLSGVPALITVLELLN